MNHSYVVPACNCTIFNEYYTLTLTYGIMGSIYFGLMTLAFLGETARDLYLQPSRWRAPVQIIKANNAGALFCYFFNCVWYIYNSCNKNKLQYLWASEIIRKIGANLAVLTHVLMIIIWYELIDKTRKLHTSNSINYKVRYLLSSAYCVYILIQIIFYSVTALTSYNLIEIQNFINGIGGVLLLLTGIITLINECRIYDIPRILRKKTIYYASIQLVGFLIILTFVVCTAINTFVSLNIARSIITQILIGISSLLMFMFVQHHTWTAYGPCTGYVTTIPYD